GILVENANDVRFHDITMQVEEGIPFEANDARNISYDRVTLSATKDSLPLMKLTNCRYVRVSNCYQPEDLELFMQQDDLCTDLYFVGNIMPKTQLLFSGTHGNIKLESNITK
ncbi:MAG: hypothetical protein JXQ80_05435, partial [Bacteroidales bacterium]|nr:hypothetical protein [Bacteroidales bacterium]